MASLTPTIENPFGLSPEQLLANKQADTARDRAKRHYQEYTEQLQKLFDLKYTPTEISELPWGHSRFVELFIKFLRSARSDKVTADGVKEMVRLFKHGGS